MLKNLLFLSLLLLFGAVLPAQILSVDPIFPRQTDTVTIVYDASQGNGALVGVTPVYAHTGLITNASSSPTDWQLVQGNWGTADPNVIMTDLGGDRHSITYHIPTFYNVQSGTTVSALAFVFRDAAGNTVGRDTDGSDIFYPVYQPGQLSTVFVTPAQGSNIVNLNDVLPIFAAASDSGTLSLTDNGSPVYQTNGDSLIYNLTVSSGGSHEVIVLADNGTTTAADTFYYTVNPATNFANLPNGTVPGINYLNNATVRLQLDAPGKDFAYVIGDFNNYALDTAYFMNKTPDNNTFWLEIGGLTPGQEYTFQYFVDGDLKIADPYSEVVLDPANDQFIPGSTYPNLPTYPDGKTTGIVTVMYPGRPAYNWQTTNYQRPDVTDLVVYELLVRDFVAAHDYETLLDSLDYLENLGVNAIELMPVMEFEGNESWGYNVSFHMALDKYYGTIDAYKSFIDECHRRGIAVIMDVVYNHAFSQSSLCQLFWDPVGFKPAANNPWLNVDARHPFNVGYDFNHESGWTQKFVKRTLDYWLEEFKIDGFRFDLSKGFTQTNSGSNVGQWGNYDASRVAILKDYADHQWATSPGSYVILEHFADNGEEKELADYGMMLWGNLVHDYNEASMGYISNSNFRWIDYQERNWNDPHVMGYMESHDEERLMFKNLSFGNSNGNYDVTDLSTALDRQELVSAFFYTIPGPKMMWQFGEVGYDVSIDVPCRVCPKPILWNYFTEPDRNRLYYVTRALMRLKQDYPVFGSTVYNHSLSGAVKKIWLDDASMNVVVHGNFDVTPQTTTADFHHTGWWYEYFTGDSINVTNVNMNVTLTAGEYRLYTDVRLPLPQLDGTITAAAAATSPDVTRLQIWPNPAQNQAQLRYELAHTGHTEVILYDLTGREMAVLARGHQAKGRHLIHIDTQKMKLPAGTYLIRIRGKNQAATGRIVVD